MKKEEYIQKYGEEAWEIRKAKNKEYMKKWHSEHIEEEKEYRKTNTKSISDRNKKWKVDNKEYVKIRDKKYRENNPRTNYFTNYRIINRNKLLEKINKYHKTKNGRAVLLSNRYNYEDKNRNFDISDNVLYKWIVDNIFSGQKCIYCGDQDWTHLGCDRIDNSKPHTPENVVCACGLCNIERADKYTVEGFKQYRALHPRACDLPKKPAIELSPTGAIKKRAVQIG